LTRLPFFRILGLAIALQTPWLPLSPSAYAHFNITFFPADTLREELATLSTDKSTKPAPNIMRGYSVKKVVIDAGHGGHDPGCVGAHSYEKDIALSICLKLADAIREKHPDVQVILTRSTDVFIPLHERARIANKNAADLFISVHCNAMPKGAQAQGSETYVLGPHKKDENLQVALRENSAVLLEENYESIYGFDPNSPEAHIIMSMFQNAYLEKSILFADKVEKHFKNSANRHSRGVKQAGFLVLRETAMPSALIETGFLSHSEEEKFLRTDEGQRQMAQAILAAFSDYKVEMEGETASAPAPAPNKGIVFKVQLAASANLLDTRQGVWAQLGYPIDALPEGGMVKYQIAAATFPQAQQIQQHARGMGFADAFIVAYQNGQRISLDTAKQQLSLK
jgi:N-acetylmuramoyl-L-alanine amidase